MVCWPRRCVGGGVVVMEEDVQAESLPHLFTKCQARGLTSAAASAFFLRQRRSAGLMSSVMPLSPGMCCHRSRSGLLPRLKHYFVVDLLTEHCIHRRHKHQAHQSFLLNSLPKGSSLASIAPSSNDSGDFQQVSCNVVTAIIPDKAC